MNVEAIQSTVSSSTTFLIGCIVGWCVGVVLTWLMMRSRVKFQPKTQTRYYRPDPKPASRPKELLATKRSIETQLDPEITPSLWIGGSSASPNFLVSGISTWTQPAPTPIELRAKEPRELHFTPTKELHKL